MSPLCVPKLPSQAPYTSILRYVLYVPSIADSRLHRLLRLRAENPILKDILVRELMHGLGQHTLGSYVVIREGSRGGLEVITNG